jgi:hypothetical protein
MSTAYNENYNLSLIYTRFNRKQKQAAPDPEAACPILLPLLDELRTYCYEHRVEDVPTVLAV